MPIYKHYLVTHRDTGEVLATPPTAPGETVFASLARNEVPIRSNCRGSSICGLCVVRVDEGLEALPEPEPDERALLDHVGATGPNERLACRIALPRGMKRLVVALDPPE